MPLSAKDKMFNREVEALRALIHSKAKPFSDDRNAQRESEGRAGNDQEYFGLPYIPHYLDTPPSELHRYFSLRYPQMVLRASETGEGDREADAAPRGNAKSTWTTLILPLWCAAYRHRLFPLIVSETAAQSADFISFIKAELETNERLKQDFPDLCGEGPVWQASQIITRNGVKIRGVGAGQKLRGMRHGSRRPALGICDDLENDESVESRSSARSWRSGSIRPS